MKIILIIAFFALFFANAANASEPDFETHKCATFRSHPLKNQISKTPTVLGFNDRIDLPFHAASKNGLFLAHYALTGVDAVPTSDLDKNGVPDYIDSALVYCERVHYYYVNTLGFKAPFSDSGIGGSNAYDLYFKDLGNDYAGYSTYGLTIGEKANSNKKYNSYTSYIILDNNFSTKDSTNYGDTLKRPTYLETGLRALYITVAHEYHHAVQFAYGSYDENNSSINEMFSVYFENIFLADSKDFSQYVNNLLKLPHNYPFSNLFYSVGYRYCVFIKSLVDKYGNSILREVWDQVYADLSPLEAINKALEAHGSSLSQAWSEFIPRMYYTGSRAGETQYIPFAKTLKEIYLYDNVNKKNQTLNTNFSGTLVPYEFRASRIINNPDTLRMAGDTLFYIYTNTDFMSAITKNNDGVKYELKTQESEFQGSKTTGIKPYYYSFVMESVPNYDTCFANKGFMVSYISNAYPNPVNLNKDAYFNIPAPQGFKLALKADVTIMTSDLREIYYASANVIFKDGYQVVQVPLNEINLSSGIYIYKTVFDGEETLGKFAVVRK